MNSDLCELQRRLAEAHATVAALVSGQVDAVAGTAGPILLADAQAALQASEERFRALLDSAPDAMVIVDGAGTIEMVNGQTARLFGYRPQELVGRPAAVLIPDYPATTERLLTCHRCDGTEFPAEIRLSAAHTPQGTFVTAAIRDVTDRVLMERAQREMQSHLALSDRMASIGTLAAGVAHEINNPLAALIGNLDLLASELDEGVGIADAARAAEARDMLKDAREAADRVRLIVRDLKLFSRGDEERRTAVAVTPLLDSSLRMAWNEIRHRARLVKVYAPVPAVDANEARLGQVFVNLLVNAAQAIPEGRAEHHEIRLVTSVDARGRVVVEVGDTGAGIAPGVLAQIFDPFFTTKAAGLGTGLGLAICQRIVTEYGGEITVESRPGEGTCFRVVLPAHRGVAAAAPEPRPPTPAATATATAARRGRILVIDDEPLVRTFVSRVLAGAHDVSVEGRAEDALACITDGRRFDVILCDVMMPQMSGADFYQALAEVAPAQAARVVFMTAGAFTDSARRFLTDNRNLRIDKPPIEARRLHAAIDALIG